MSDSTNRYCAAQRDDRCTPCAYKGNTELSHSELVVQLNVIHYIYDCTVIICFLLKDSKHIKRDLTLTRKKLETEYENKLQDKSSEL